MNPRPPVIGAQEPAAERLPSPLHGSTLPFQIPRSTTAGQNDPRVPLIWLFRVTVASATPSPSGLFRTRPVTEKPITWKTGWGGRGEVRIQQKCHRFAPSPLCSSQGY